MADPQVAREMISILERDGWNQGYVTYPYPDNAFPGEPWRHGSHCIGGAASLALSGGATDAWPPSPFYVRLLDAICDFDPGWRRSGPSHIHSDIATWNNSHPREDVMAVLHGMDGRG
jgi:hypothetical protein